MEFIRYYILFVAIYIYSQLARILLLFWILPVLILSFSHFCSLPPFDSILAWTWQRCGLKWQCQLKAIISWKPSDFKPNNTNNEKKWHQKWPHFRHRSWFPRHHFNQQREKKTPNNIKIKIMPFHSLWQENELEKKSVHLIGSKI